MVVLIVGVSSLGLLGSSVAVHFVMRSVLVDQADTDLYSSLTGWAQNPGLYEQGQVRPPTEFSVLVISPYSGIHSLNDRGSRPNFQELTINAEPQTVSSLAGSAEDIEWRAIGASNPSSGVITVVAKSMEREKAMLRWLGGVQGVISVMALAMIAVAGAVLVRRSLRPLREVEATAKAISAGDLDRRVPSWPQETEVGQLSISLNTMLARLQDSLETAHEKEVQMRRFVGDASHELRTPLTSVRGYTELYRSGATQDVDRVLDKISDESGRMQLLVEDLLALTRAEGSRLNKQTVDLLEISLAAASSMRAAFPGRSVEVTNRTSSVPLVDGDPDRLHQVLTNLITNALRHAGEDAEVRIELHRDDDPGNDDVLIDVADDGKGMSEEAAGHIFERFYREDSSRSRGTGGGSGLGLSIVRSLVEQHGGKIGVISELGEGTTFRIRLPELKDSSEEQ